MLKKSTLLSIALFSGLAFTPAVQAAEQLVRPTVGLVLGGGGARGAAHIGVLEVLEEMRVPVDCVVGTSMGALITGAYASGLSPKIMREEMARADWKDMFIDSPEFSDVAYRTKQFMRQFIPSSETGVTAKGVTYPSGAVEGQKIKLFFNHLVGSGRSERVIELLPIKISMIATDIGTGDRVVLREGSLTTAMRASMSVPGVLAPVVYQGRKLVDGGLVDNVPIAEARERCNPDVIVAVNVGSPLLKSEEVGSLLSVSAQMFNLLTEQNVTRSLATLRPEDIYIRPDLGEIATSDFSKNSEAADRGKLAAESVRDQLAKLTVSPEDYADWRRKIDRTYRAPKTVDHIEVLGLERVNPAMVNRQITVHPGDSVDLSQIEEDVQRIYGDGLYQRVDYSLLEEREKNILRILPVEKYWGPDYLRFALNLDADTSEGSSFSLRGAYHKTLINSYGAEALVGLQVGNTIRADFNFYQPLDPARHYFVETELDFIRGTQNIYQDDARIAQYIRETTQVKLGVGANLGLMGVAKLNWVEQHINFQRDIGSVYLPNFVVDNRGVEADLIIDQMNRLYFSSRGWGVKMKYFDSAAHDYSRIDLDANAAMPFGKTVISGRASYTGSPNGQLPFYDAAKLGGFSNMSAYAKGQVVGDDISYLGFRAERIIGDLGLGLRGDIRFGVSLEGAHVGRFYTETGLRGSAILNSVGAYLASETPVGPLYVGVGYSMNGYSNLFFSIGIPD